MRQRTVRMPEGNKIIRGRDLEDICLKVRRKFPEVKNFQLFPYLNKPGLYLSGQDEEGRTVLVPNL